MIWISQCFLVHCNVKRGPKYEIHVRIYTLIFYFYFYFIFIFIFIFIFLYFMSLKALHLWFGTFYSGMQSHIGGAPISHSEGDFMSSGVILSNSDDGALKRKVDFEESLHEIKDDCSYDQRDILCRIDSMYQNIFPGSNDVWLNKANALPVVSKVIDALYVMIASMKEELLEMNEKMGQNASGNGKLSVNTESELGNSEASDDYDDKDTEERDPFAYAALAAVRDDDKKRDEALKQRAIDLKYEKCELVNKAVEMVKARGVKRDIANGGRGEYRPAIDMRVDKALFDRFNKCMVTSDSPINDFQNGAGDNFTFFLVTLNMYTELLKRMEKYEECKELDMTSQTPLPKRTRLHEPLLLP